VSAADDSAQLQLAPYFKAIRRRALLIGAIVLAAVGAAEAVSLSETPQYESSARIFLSQGNPVENIIPATGSQTPADPERDLNSRLSLITTPSVASRVVDHLKLKRSPESVLSEVSATLDTNSNIATITVQDSSARRAAAIANSFATEYAASRTEAARATIAGAARLAQRQFALLSPADRTGPQGTQLARSARELQIAAALQTGNVEVVDMARPPGSASSPKPVLNGVLAGILGLLFGLGVAIALGFLDRRLRDIDDVDIHGLPLLATVPHSQTLDRLNALDMPESREALLTLATNLRFFNLGHDVETLAVTSPGPQEGKTSVTLGLSRALTEIGLRVVTLECDLRRPTFRQTVGLPPGGGISTVLAGVSTFDREVVKIASDTMKPLEPDAPDGTPFFSVVPAGPVPPNPQGLLSSAEMAHVVKYARAQADVVLLDTAPVGPVNDVVTLAELVSGIVLLARLGHTRKDALDRALRTLNHLVTPVLGVVVTGARRRRGEDYRYHYAQVSPSVG
jgi:receptor protein-tyrosine kinase